jgi:hypothetical protein
MKRLALAALSLLLAWTAARLVAQESREPSPDPFFSSDTEPAEAPVATPDESPQRDRFLELMRARADLMDDAQLEAAIQQAEAEIQDLQARRMLTDARKTLLRLIETYPETCAANDARRMLGQEAGPSNVLVPEYPESVPYYEAPAETNAGVPSSLQPVFEPESPAAEPRGVELPAFEEEQPFTPPTEN